MFHYQQKIRNTLLSPILPIVPIAVRVKKPAVKKRFLPYKMHVKSLLDTHLFPCSIERLNSDNLAICGCYELDEASGTRQGELLLLGIESDNGEFMIDVKDKVTLEAGILDCKVLGGGFYAGLSTETLVHYLVNDQQGYRITETASISRPDEGLFLSVSPIITGSEATVAVSTQSGSILVYQHNDSGFRETMHIKACHPMFDEPMPVWIVALNQHNDSVLVSGGDDMKLRFWDLRQGEMPIATKKIHDAGVTTAQWHPHHENIVAVGSYDESCSIWDYRSLREPLVRFETGANITLE